MAPVAAVAAIAFFTCAGVADGLAARYSAAAPATCGDAIDVPLIATNPFAFVEEAETIETPGALTFTQLPRFEKPTNVSFTSVAPTVIAAAMRAGDDQQASDPAFPAAATVVTPALIIVMTAWSSMIDAELARLMFATIGVPGDARFCRATQSRPARSEAPEPLPLQPSTRTGTMRTDFATP